METKGNEEGLTTGQNIGNEGWECLTTGQNVEMSMSVLDPILLKIKLNDVGLQWNFDVEPPRLEMDDEMRKMFHEAYKRDHEAEVKAFWEK